VPTIRIDDEVLDWLRENARPFTDTPNSVLRRMAGLEKKEEEMAIETKAGGPRPRRARSNSGRRLNEEWQVGAKHPLYHRDGTFYEQLREFPGALFDRNGYVVFSTEKKYLTAPGLHHGEKLNVPEGISSLHGYIKKR
jgi:5-methylcytosine-specific restriction protein A